MASKRTVQFEFLIDADARQLDQFHNTLKRVGEGTAVTEQTLTSLREELQRFASISDKTENTLQAQISALRDASRNADLTRKEYVSLRTEIGVLEREYKDLTTGVVGLGRAYEQAGRQAEAFNRRAQKIAERQRYEEGTPGFAFNPSTLRTAPQAGRDASGRLIAPGSLNGPAYAGMGDMGFGQFGPSAAGFERMSDMGFGQYGPAIDPSSEAALQKRIADLQREASLLGQSNPEYARRITLIRQLAAEQQRLQSLNSADLQGQATVLGSSAAFEQRIAQLRQEASQMRLGTQEYKQRALEVRRLEKELRDLSLVESQADIRNRRRQRFGREIRELGSTASAIGIGGFFGGPEGLAGSTLGGIAGAVAGPGGMAAGAAIGASIGLGIQQLRMQSTMVGTLVSQLNLAKTALAQVSASQEDYNQKLQFARQVSTDYSVGLQTTIEGYARVTAAAAANGLTLKETETIYRGMIASGVAFGASQADLDSIIRATTQVLSKGRISMEEISQQLGERIPGAMVRFAQLTGRSLQQLNKDFEDGKVNMADFLKFAKGQLDEYDQAARLIGSSPEKAGERLQLALTRMAETYGGFFQKLGAQFQDSATQVVNWAISQENAIKTLVGTMIWGGRQIKQFFDNAFAGVRLIEQAAGFIPGVAIGNAARGPLQSVLGGGLGLPSPTGGPGGGFFADRLREAGGLFPQFTPSRFGGSQGNPNLGEAAAEDDEKARRKAQAEADKRTRMAEQLAAEQRRRDELLANNAIRLADRVFQHQQGLIRRRYELENELIEATRRAQEAALIGPAREALSLRNRLAVIIEESRRAVRESEMEVEARRQAVTSARASEANRARFAEVPMSAVGRGGSGFGGGARTGWTRDRDAEQSGFDVVLPGGVGGRVPNPVNQLKITGVGFQGRGSGATGRGYGNYVTGEFVGIDGKKYEMLLGHFNKVEVKVGDILSRGDTIGRQGETGRTFGTHVTTHVNALNGGNPWRALRDEVVSPWVRGWGGGRTQPGVAAGLNRLVVDTGDTQLAQRDLAQAEAESALVRAQSAQLLQQRLTAEILGSTEAYRTQTQSIKDQQQELQLRNRLQMEGVSPEVIEQQIQLDQATTTYTRNLEQLNEQLRNTDAAKQPELYRATKDAIEQLTAAYNDQIAAQKALNEVQNDPNRKINRRMGELRNELSELRTAQDVAVGISGTIEQSFSQAMSSAINDTIAGTGTIQEAMAAMFQRIGAAFVEMAAQIIAKQAVLGILGLFTGGGGGGVGGLLGGGLGFGGGGSLVGGLFSGAGPVAFPSAGSFGFANGGVMTAHGPLKLQTYARGGIANTPQMAVFGEGSMPEAFVPLPDGRRIPVAMQGPANAQAAPADPPEPIRVETTVINGVEYATVDQLRQSVRQTESMVYSRLQQSTKVRRRLGMS